MAWDTENMFISERQEGILICSVVLQVIANYTDGGYLMK